MGRKIRAAKASLVAAFVAAGGAGAAKAVQAQGAKPANTIGGASAINWGDPLIRFIKLDGFPSYFKYDGSAHFAQYYKWNVLEDAATLYWKYEDQVAGVLDLYHKANAGQLSGILIGLQQFYKEKNLEPLLEYLKTPGAMDAYIKFESFFSALQAVDPDGDGAFGLFYKETGIAGNPLRNTDGQIG